MKSRILSILISVLFVPATIQMGMAAEGMKKLTLDLYLEMEGVANPKLSPDGTQIVYARQWTDKLNDRRESSIWIMNADGTRNRFLVDGSSPVWSPDGTRIAYLGKGEPKGSQIFVRWMDAEGATSQLTRVEESPSNLTWSPDSKSLAFTMLVPSKNRWSIKMPSRPEGAKWTADPTIIESFSYRRDRVGFIEEGYTHVFMVPDTGGTPRQITQGDYHHRGSFSFTPDGKEILFSGLRQDDWEYQWRESEIYAVDVASREIRQLTTRKGPDGNPEVSPDGRWVAYTGYDWTGQTYITSRLYVMGIDGSNPRLLTPDLDRDPGDLKWTPDSSGIYFNVMELGTGNLYFTSLDGTTRKVTDGNHILDISDISDQGVAVGTLTSPQEPEDVVIFDLSNPQPRQLTFVNDDILSDVTLGAVEEVRYPSVGGLEIQGWLVKPPDFDPAKTYPLMLSIHGGPHGMYGVGFNFGWQEHAANGYLVLYTNPRGSSGYGTDFGNAINNAYPSQDYDDLINGVDTVINNGWVDEKNMFVYGCSGGGVLTAWVVGHTDRFAAASSNCPVINWMSFVGTTDGNLHWYRNFKKLPWEDPSEHLQRSPLMYVGNVKTPTMLMTGELDLRTPISQTEEFYQALKILKVPTAMVRFKEEYHGTGSKPSNFIRTQLYLRHWFEKYTTKGEGSGESPPVANSKP